MLEVLRWSSNATNRFWRLQYASNLWVSRADTEKLVRDCLIFTDARPYSKSIIGNVTYVSFSIMGPAIFYSDFAIHPLRKDGYSTLSTLTARAGFKLYKIRPKLHMMCRVLALCFLGKWMDGKNVQSMDHKNVAKKMLPKNVATIAPSDLPSGLI